MRKQIVNGVYPVMMTPFKDNGQVDYKSLINLTKWYDNQGADGLFAICQSSEMFDLSLDEKIKIIKTIKETTKLPIVASGHTQDSLNLQVSEMKKIANTNVDAIVLLTNRFANENEDDEVFINNLSLFLEQFPKNIPLGLYECPYPYKRILSTKELAYILQTKRFVFLKDTSCDISIITRRLEQIKGTTFKLYNANAPTLIESLKKGASGYSGIHANYSTKLLKYIVSNYSDTDDKFNKAHDLMITIRELAAITLYPVSAKFHQLKSLVISSIKTRVKDDKLMTDSMKEAVRDVTIQINEMERLL